jgi:hypothetical protein
MLSGKPQEFVKQGHDLIVRVPPVPSQRIEEETSVALMGHCTSMASSILIVVAAIDDLRFVCISIYAP